jgi:hypothetical protein
MKNSLEGFCLTLEGNRIGKLEEKTMEMIVT